MVVRRYLTHAVVLVIGLSLAVFSTYDGTAIHRSLASVNAESLVIGEGGQVGDVKIGRLSTIVKPVSVPASAPQSHVPINYVVGVEERLKSLVAKFGVSEESIRWSNFSQLRITTSDVKPGDKIVIPPVNGVVVTVEPGDSADTLANFYHVDKQVIVDFNYLRSDYLSEGLQLVLPGARGPEFMKPVPIAAVASPPAPRASVGGPMPGGYTNRFYYGYCTYYVASRVQIPWLGDAIAWFGQAQAYGWATGQIPRRGALYTSTENASAGHVALVEQVNPDGSFLISEMNYVGWNIISQRTLKLPFGPFTGFIYPPGT